MIFDWAAGSPVLFVARGGQQIQAECDEIGTIPVGGAAITSGGNLKAPYVIHAASMQLGGQTSAHALRSSTAHALRIAAQKGLKTIAFPAVGTGIAGFPVRECAEIMLRETVKHFENPTPIEKIYFVLFDQATLLGLSRSFCGEEDQTSKAASLPADDER